MAHVASRLARGLAVSIVTGVVVVAGVWGATTAPVPYHVSVAGGEDAARARSGSVTGTGPVVQTRNSLWRGTDVASDARARGKWSVVLNEDQYPSGRIDFWGMHTLRNAKGSWKGPHFGIRDAAGSHYVSSANVGTGAHAGLTYWIMVIDYRSGTAAEHTFEVYGWIERGTVSLEPSVSTGHVRVTARERSLRTSSGVETATETATFTRGARWAGTTAASDARLEGTQRLVLDTMTFANGRRDVWGSYALRGSDGSWVGRVWGVRTPDGRHVRWIDAKGTGAYAALRYRAVARSAGGKQATSQAWNVDGWIEPIR